MEAKNNQSVSVVPDCIEDGKTGTQLIQFVIENLTDCNYNLQLFQQNQFSVNATLKYAWDITGVSLTCGLGGIVINGVYYNLIFQAGTLTALLNALNALGFGFFCTTTQGGNTYIFTVDNTNVYGTLTLCAFGQTTSTTTTTTTRPPTTTTTTTLAPGQTTTTTSTTTSTTTIQPTTTSTTTTTTTAPPADPATTTLTFASYTRIFDGKLGGNIGQFTFTLTNAVYSTDFTIAADGKPFVNGFPTTNCVGSDASDEMNNISAYIYKGTLSGVGYGIAGSQLPPQDIRYKRTTPQITVNGTNYVSGAQFTLPSGCVVTVICVSGTCDTL
jgi:hypothetical protein